MTLLLQLKGGDLRSIGRADEVAKKIGKDQKLFDEVFQGIFAVNSIIRMRAADVCEKVSQKYPDLLKKHKSKILNNLNNFEQQEVRWHVALMISYLKLNKLESEKVFMELSKWIINDKSRIVKVNSMQALAEIAINNAYFKLKTTSLIKKQIKTGIPSLMSRGKKLLKLINENQ